MELVEKLEKWVREHPKEADEPFIDITTQKETTVREISGELKEEREAGIAILDEETRKIVKQIEQWVGGL